MSRTSTFVESVSEIMTDENGFEFINIVLGDGIKGFFPGKADTLSAFQPGTPVLYSGVKKFNGMDKINGLTVEDKKPAEPEVKSITYARITAVSDVSTYKGWFLRDITLDTGITASVVAKQPSALSQYKIGNLVSFSSVRTGESNRPFFDNFKKELEYGSEDRRNLSIMRQSCLKVAAELYLAANSTKLAKSAGVNWDDVVAKLTYISNKLVNYTNVD